MDREQRREILFYIDKHDMPDSVGAFAEFAARVASAADAIKARGDIIIESDDSYHDGWQSLTAFYWRDETDEDVAKREAEAAQRRADSDARERAQYERLKSKFAENK